MELPEDLLYSTDHEWVRAEPEGRIRVGVTDYAQDALGDVVYVQIPTVGAQVKAGESFSEVESTKSVSDIYAPASGTIVEVNDALGAQPELVNSDPYGQGWLCIIATSAPDELDGLLDAAAYRALIEG
jgi:glycine cleavage system H protein